MKLFNLVYRFIMAVRDTLFGPDSHSAGRYEWVSLRDNRIRPTHAPAVEDLSTIPREVIQGAQVAVDNAFFDREAVRKEMEKEMEKEMR